MRSEQYEQIDPMTQARSHPQHGAGSALGMIKLPFQGHPPSPDLVRWLARDSCFFGTNQPLRVGPKPAVT
jgi:hypothetical protein